jgi:hypothetical protein
MLAVHPILQTVMDFFGHEINPTVTVIELLWVVVTSIGFTASSWVMWDAIKDWRYFKLTRLNGFRKIVALSNLRHDILGFTINFFLWTAGLLALATTQFPLTPARLLTIFVLMMAALALAANSILDRHDRKKLISYKDESLDAEIMRDIAREESQEVFVEGAEASLEAVRSRPDSMKRRTDKESDTS